MRRWISVFIVSVLTTGCASLNSVSLTPIPVNRDRVVTAEASRWIIFGFNFDNDFVDTVSRNLSDKCPNGKVSGILTKDEAYLYVSVFVMKRQVTATGFCEVRKT